VLHLAEVHFNLVSNYSSTETILNIYKNKNLALWCASVRIVAAKKSADSLLCGSDLEKISDGELLKVLSMRAGFTISQAAKTVGICWQTLMNYESGRTKVKGEVLERIVGLYSEC